MRNIYIIIMGSLLLLAKTAFAADHISAFTLPSGVKVKIVEARFQKILIQKNEGLFRSGVRSLGVPKNLCQEHYNFI